MGHSPATENRHKINKDDYKGMFLLAKIGVIAVHCLMEVLFQCVVRLLLLFKSRASMAIAMIETPVVLRYYFMCEHHGQINVQKVESF